MIRALFLCGMNNLPSPTAGQVFASCPNVETDSAGLLADATTVLSTEQIEWATIIFVMEKTHLNRLRSKYRSSLRNARIICLDIPDEYEFMDPELIEILKTKVSRFLQRR